MTKFSTDFKLNVVKFYLENNVSKHEIAKQFGVIKSEVIKGYSACHGKYNPVEIHFFK